MRYKAWFMEKSKKTQTLVTSLVGFLLYSTTTSAGEPDLAAILIPYRDDGAGKGAFYDHHTLQKLTNHPTVSDATEVQQNALKTHADTLSFKLSFGEKATETAKPLPGRSREVQEKAGLLVIPGRIRVNENDATRTQIEKKVIQNAINRGQPIIALCAGCWQLWDSYGGKTVNVSDHCYGGGMVRLDDKGRVTHNVQLHDILVQKNSLLADAMGFKTATLPKDQDAFKLLVNSVHWKAPDQSLIPPALTVCATTKRDPKVTVFTRQSMPMLPQEDTAEAFESTFGAPVLGVQWHPEAYNSDDKALHKNRKNPHFLPEKHIALLCYMAKAGDAYQAKCRMLAELKNKPKGTFTESTEETKNNTAVAPCPIDEVTGELRKVAL